LGPERRPRIFEGGLPVRLSWNDIRARAAKFSGDWAGAHYERGETQSFYNDFFEIFGVRRRRVATFEQPVKKLGDKQGFIDLFWKGVLLVEHKSAGRDLSRARTQALDYFPGLKDHELPRYVLVCDFQHFELIDLDTREETRFALSDLREHVEKFGFIVGVEKRVFKDQDPVNVIAAELMGKLHDALKASGYVDHPLERLLVRLLFCLFADDTGIFPERGMLEDFIVNRTNPDGGDLGPWLSQIFQVLDTPEDKRQSSLDEDLAKLPYVNGDLFAETLPIAACDRKMRELFIEACGFSWEKISPAIFGALFQSVMNAKERRAKGAHYTTEKNILKVIEPLFLDDLRAEFSHIKGLKRGRETALRAFQDKLAGLNLFDPACGCGNFLVISYRELRALEIEVLKVLYPAGQLDLEAAALSKVDVNQFHGIEIDEFPARIAETAMWMMDHIMNNRLSLEFGRVFARIPLRAAPNIVHGDALEIDWATVLAPETCSFLLGNPPFSGFTLRDDQRAKQIRNLDHLGAAGSRLYYVAYWFLKAGAYLRRSDRDIRIGFVSTNSITQGEQVPQLWPALFKKYRLEISFAHTTFPWGSDARGKAHVHVVVVGLAKEEFVPAERRLFSARDEDEAEETLHRAISPYLFGADNLSDFHLVVKKESKPINGLPPIRKGVEPVDDGHYILTADELAAFRSQEPEALKAIFPLVGGREYINGQQRWILVPFLIPAAELRALPLVLERIKRVRAYRLNGGPLAKSMADRPAEFHVFRQPKSRFLVIPEVSSIRREYIPIGWLSPPDLPSGKTRFVAASSEGEFAILTSRMHMSWVRYIGGRVKSDYSYSGNINYNPFPWPKLTADDKHRLDALGQAVLDARAAHEGATLADLYDPDVMPTDLRKAHRALDTAVDRLYRKEPFGSDRERVEHLFRLYENMTAGLLAHGKPKRAAPVRRRRAT
jgi:hypothetical protein